MANKYTKADEETLKMLDAVVAEHHDDLSAHGVTFDVLFGFAPTNDEGERTGPALKIHGYPTNSISSITNLKNRVKGNADVEIILDGDSWGKLTTEQKTAILDRAVEHFELARNVDGESISDTHGRPKIKMVQADWQISIFNSIAHRHGLNSPEGQQLSLLAESGQLKFPFLKKVSDKK